MGKITVYHIIVAAGNGTRYGAGCPKQFCPLNGRPLLMTTVGRMRAAGGTLILVLNPDWIDPWADMCAVHGFDSPEVVAGGATRWESVRNALEYVPVDADVITVHDGARPAVDADTIKRVVEAVVAGADGAIPVVAVTDSLREMLPEGLSRAVERSRFRAVQTPQAFRSSALKAAYRLPYRSGFTDDASVMEAAGFTCLKLVDGNPGNIKVTNPGDILRLEAVLDEKR